MSDEEKMNLFYKELDVINNMGDGPESRQKSYELAVKYNYMLDHDLTFNDCNDIHDLSDAVLKLLVDNFDIGHHGTHIRDIIYRGIFEGMSYGLDEGPDEYLRLTKEVACKRSEVV